MEPSFDEKAVENLRAAFDKVKLAALFFLMHQSIETPTLWVPEKGTGRL